MKLLLLLACAGVEAPPTTPVRAPPVVPTPAETDLAFAGAGAWTLGGHVVTLSAGTLTADGAPILAHVYDDPVVTDDTLYVPADPGEGDGGIYAVRVLDGDLAVSPLLTEGRPDRLALSPDAATLAFVAGTTGIASLWSMPTAGGPVRQLTNVNVVRTPGHAPVGFVPPPERGPARFDGATLVWTVEGVERVVPWR